MRARARARPLTRGAALRRRRRRRRRLKHAPSRRRAAQGGTDDLFRRQGRYPASNRGPVQDVLPPVSGAGGAGGEMEAAPLDVGASEPMNDYEARAA